MFLRLKKLFLQRICSLKRISIFVKTKFIKNENHTINRLQ